MAAFEKSISQYLPFLEPGELMNKAEKFISSQLVNFFDRISEVLSSIVSVIAILVIVPFVTFFLLKDHRKILHGHLAHH